VSSLAGMLLRVPAVSADATSGDLENRAKGSVHFSPGKVGWIDSSVLAKMLEDRDRQNISFYLVDLRLEADYQKGHISGAVNIPSQKLRFVAEKIFGKTDPVVFYGYARNSEDMNAVIRMMNKGYVRLSVLTGGIESWQGVLEPGAE